MKGKSSIVSQFHQYQQNEQSLLILTELIEHKKDHALMQDFHMTIEKFEDGKGVIRRCNWKNRQCNGQQKREEIQDPDIHFHMVW